MICVELVDQGPQGQFVAERSTTADETVHHGRKDRGVPELLPRMHIRHVDFDTRNGNGGNGVADRIAVMRVRPGIDDQPLAMTRTVHEADELPLAVALSAANTDPKLDAQLDDPFLDGLQCLIAVDADLAFTQQVQVGPVDAGPGRDASSSGDMCTSFSVGSCRNGGTIHSKLGLVEATLVDVENVPVPGRGNRFVNHGYVEHRWSAVDERLLQRGCKFLG
jgi:hypothetical protein